MCYKISITAFCFIRGFEITEKSSLVFSLFLCLIFVIIFTCIYKSFSVLTLHSIKFAMILAGRFFTSAINYSVAILSHT